MQRDPQENLCGVLNGNGIIVKGDLSMSYQIINVCDHYEVYINGIFICSGDTYSEASREADKCLVERR
jgi:hypothetical protein